MARVTYKDRKMTYLEIADEIRHAIVDNIGGYKAAYITPQGSFGVIRSSGWDLEVFKADCVNERESINAQIASYLRIHKPFQ